VDVLKRLDASPPSRKGELAAYDANPPQPYAQALSRIWPFEHSQVQWPPSAYVSPETLDAVVNWGQPTRSAT
jgi:hypothetical protein